MGMMRKLWMRLGLAVLVLGLCVVPPAQAASQDDDDKVWMEPGVAPLKDVKEWKQWIAAILFLVGCSIVGFKDPHRSHLD